MIRIRPSDNSHNVVPAGTYEVSVRTLEQKEGKFGGDYLTVELEVLDPAFVGRTIRGFCSLAKADQLSKLSKLYGWLLAFGFELAPGTPYDLEELLLGRRALAVVTVGLVRGIYSNKVERLLPLYADERLPGWCVSPALPPTEPVPESQPQRTELPATLQAARTPGVGERTVEIPRPLPGAASWSCEVTWPKDEATGKAVLGRSGRGGPR